MEAWKELSDSYELHRKTVQADMEKRKRTLASARSKGKERASEDDLDDWDVERRDLPEQFLSSGSVDRARRLLSDDSSKTSSLQAQLKELEYTVRSTFVRLGAKGSSNCYRWTDYTPSPTPHCKRPAYPKQTWTAALPY